MGVLKEFKEFAIKGNVVDLAVGLVVGVAFGKIVTSLVNDLLMPPLGMAMGKVDFSRLAWVLKAADGEAPVVAVRYGAFLNTVVDFIIVAFAIFLVVRQINRIKHKPDPTTKPCPYCQTNIPLKATRCPNCTSQLNAAAVA